MKRHIASKHDVSKNEIIENAKTCSICNKKFATKWKKNQHFETVHERKKPFRCDICDGKYVSKISLENHIAAIHEGKKSHLCSLLFKKEI